MGDENSLAGTTKAHKHTLLASDGGFLETTETGVTNMSEGSIGYYDSSSVLTELNLGSASDVLTVNAGGTAPEWATAGGGATLNYQTATSTTTQSTTSNSFVTLTSFSFTLAGSGSGNAVCNYNTNIMGSGTAPIVRWNFSVDGAQPESCYWFLSGNARYSTFFGCSSTLSSQTAEMQFKCEATGTVYVQMDSLNGLAYVLEIS